MSFTDRAVIVTAVANTLAAFAALIASYFAYQQTRYFIQSTRPFLLLSLNRNEDITNIRYFVENSGSIPARLIFTRTSLWIDGIFDENKITTYGSWDSEALSYRENRIHLNEIKLDEQTVQSVNAEKSELTVGACVIYESLMDNDGRRWESRAFHQYQGNEPLLLQASEFEVASREKECSLSIESIPRLVKKPQEKILPRAE